MSIYNDDLDDLLGYESKFYVESMIGMIDKPFINPGKLNNNYWVIFY